MTQVTQSSHQFLKKFNSKSKKLTCQLISSNTFCFTRLVYLDATLLEVQRKISLTPMGVPHFALVDAELAGYHIPKVCCSFSLFLIVKFKSKIKLLGYDIITTHPKLENLKKNKKVKDNINFSNAMDLV